MGWVTLSLRRMEDHVLVNNLELQLIGISRQRQRLLNQKSLRKAEAKADIGTAKDTAAYSNYIKARDAYKNADVNSEDYANIQKTYNLAKEEYEAQKTTSEEILSDEMEQIEAEMTEAENDLDVQQAEIEAQLSAVRAELDAVKQSIDQDIKSSTIKLS